MDQKEEEKYCFEMIISKPMDKITFLRDVKKEELSDFLGSNNRGNNLGYHLSYPNGNQGWVSEHEYKTRFKEIATPKKK